MEGYMLTTTDNPYNPFTHFEEWYAFDCQRAREEGRAPICQYLAAVAQTSTELSERDFNQSVDDAIEEIIELNLSGKYKKITEEEAKTLV